MGNSIAGRLRALHSLLTDHLFYPIVLSSLLAMGIYIARALYSWNWVVYRNMVVNLFLAWLPYFFCLLAICLHRAKPGQWWWLVIPGSLWLIFFPNAPYIITDFFHLEMRPPVPLWYDILLLVAFTWTGLFLGLTSLRSMHLIMESYLGRFLGWCFVTFSLALGGLGIYLGRFARWNSWDLLHQPKQIIKDVLEPLINPQTNIRFFGFTFLFTAFLVVCYLTFISTQRINASQEAREKTIKGRV
jgi:uncharacterized membrane protein